MSKILEATCDAEGVVKVGEIEVPDVIVLSAGTQESTGLLFLDGEKKVYLPSSASDIASTIQAAIDTITEVAAAVTKIGTTLTAIGAGMTGPTTAPPPTLAVDVAELNTKVTALNAIKSDLDELKGALK